MTGLRTLLGDVTRWASVGLALAAAVVLFAPIAAATPESDADAAIGQAWDAGGGETGPLGPKDGDVYPIGAGFGQNFAGGKVYFTPETGAHIMLGAILDKYLSLGGPADGDLGFPTIDEGDGKAPDSRNTTFSAADNPVIFFTPDTGAHVVRGAINAAWDKLGGSAGVLGVPTDDEVYRGDVTSQTFSGGQLSWDAKAKAFTTTPPELADQLAGLAIPGDATTAIDAARRAAGGSLGPLGAAEGPPSKIGSDGLVQTFEGGKIFYSPATGANVMTGQVLAKYESVGGPGGDLGFPTSSEADAGLAPMSRIGTFGAADQPVIFWTPDFGAVIVRGAMNAAWTKLGGASGELGPPTADQTVNGNVITQKFNSGAISYDESTKKFTTEPANLASSLTGLTVPGQNVPQGPPVAQASNEGGGDHWYSNLFSKLRWWSLLAIIPILLLVAAIVAAVVLNRRRNDDRAPLNEFDDYDDHRDDHRDDGEFASGPVPVTTSGPVPLTAPGSADDDARAPLSAWSMPAGDGQHDDDDDGDAETRLGPADLPDSFPDDQDSIDTAPNRIQSMESIESDQQAEPEAHPEPEPEPEPEPGLEPEPSTEADEYEDDEAEPASGPPSGRHAAIVLEPAPAQTALRLALDDPFQAPAGYPVKADTNTGLYWMPGSGDYDAARAEIWFASEEFALTNGFVKG